MANPFTTAQAPMLTQLIAPDIAQEQNQLLRRQQMADLLRQQALTPMGNTETVGGWAIKKSPLEGLAKIAQALGSNYMQEKNDARQMELAKALQGRMGDVLNGTSTNSTGALAAGAAHQPSTPGPDGEMVNQGGVGPTNANAARIVQPGATQATPNNFNMASLLRGQVISDIGGQGAGAAYWDSLKATDAAKRDRELGYTTPESRATEDAKRFKEGYIAPVNARPGSILRDPRTNMPMAFNPHVPDGSAPTFDASGNVTGMNPIAGATDAISAAERAKAMGTAQATPTVAYNGSTPIFSTKAQDVGRATGAPAGNPAPNSGLPTDNDPRATANELAAAQASLANVTDPASRKMLEGHISDLKASQQKYSLPTQAGIPAGSTSSVTPQLPPGLTANADTAQKASAQTMHESYAKLQAGNSSAQAALDALEKMQGIAAKKNALLTAGKLGTGQTAINPEAAEYEKQRANLIAQLAQQNGTGGTDAGRALTGESVPDFGKPKAAIADGLATLKNQTIAQQLKTNFLTPHYQAGDSKKFTELQNQFDQNISPSMVPLLTAQPGPARAAQLQAAAKDPKMRARLEWAAQNGLLK